MNFKKVLLKFFSLMLLVIADTAIANNIQKLSSSPSACEASDFSAQLSSYSTLERGESGGGMLLAQLAIIGSVGNAHYQKIEELAKHSNEAAKLKSYIDIVKKEMKISLEKAAQYRKLALEVKKEFEQKYKSEDGWKTKRYFEFLNELDSRAMSKGLPKFIDTSGPKFPNEILADFDIKTKLPTSMEISPQNGQYQMLKQMARSFVAEMIYTEISRGAGVASIHTDSKKSPEESKASILKRRRYYNWYQESIGETSSTVEKNLKSGQVRSGTLSAFGIVGLESTKMVNRKKAVLKCYEGFDLTNEEIDKVSSQLDPKSVPGLFLSDQGFCDSLKLLPSASTELQDLNGFYSHGVCKLLHRELQNVVKILEPTFSVDSGNCKEESVKINNNTIGTFNRINENEVNFDIRPLENSFGMSFPIHYASGIDFDPQTIECYRLVGKSPDTKMQSVPSCSSSIRNNVAAGETLDPKMKASRMQLFHSKQSCRTIGSKSAQIPFCKFADNAQQIRQAFSAYSIKCMHALPLPKKGSELQEIKSTR